MMNISIFYDFRTDVRSYATPMYNMPLGCLLSADRVGGHSSAVKIFHDRMTPIF